MIKFLWTGEYKPPKEGEWYLFADSPHQAMSDHEPDMPQWILRRVEESGVDDESK